MSRLPTTRWLVFLLVAAVIAVAAGASPAEAAPASQSQVSVVVFAYVDVASPGEPNTPCNLQFDDEDEQYALGNPLSSMWYNLQDGGGTQIARQESSALATLQRVRFENIDEMPAYRLVLEAAPSGWALCPQESATRDLDENDFVLGSARETYHFYRPDLVTPGAETPMPTDETPVATVTLGPSPTPSPTITPGGPTLTPPPPPTIAPQPTKDDDDDDGQGGGGDNGGSTAPKDLAGRGKYGAIQGIAFIDTNANGIFEAGEPGLNDVQINLHGGGLELKHITDGTGTYNFEVLGDGQYDVFINPGDEWYITTPEMYTVAVAGLAVTGIDFGLIRYTDLPANYEKTTTTTATTAETATNIKLPSTGVANLPASKALAGLALLLGALGLVGLTTERWWKGRQ